MTTRYSKLEDTVTGQSAKGKTWVGEPDVRSGIAGSSRAISWFRRFFLHAYCRSSYIRMVEEICSLPFRIRATRRRNATLPGRGYELPLPVGQIGYFGLLQSCNQDMQRLGSKVLDDES
jgi:hypothetical protein